MVVDIVSNAAPSDLNPPLGHRAAVLDLANLFNIDTLVHKRVFNLLQVLIVLQLSPSLCQLFGNKHTRVVQLISAGKRRVEHIAPCWGSNFQ